MVESWVGNTSKDFFKPQPDSWFSWIPNTEKRLIPTLATITYIPLWLNYRREAGRLVCLGTKCVLHIPADVSVVWGDHVTLTTKSIPVSRAGPWISLHFTNITLFLLEVHQFFLSCSASWTSTNCPSRTTKRSPRKIDDRLPHQMCVTFACQILTPLYFPLNQFPIL